MRSEQELNQVAYEIRGAGLSVHRAIGAPVHSRQLQTYLRLSGCPLGFILNFGAARFLDGVVRQVNNFPVGTPPYSEREEIVTAR